MNKSDGKTEYGRRNLLHINEDDIFSNRKFYHRNKIRFSQVRYTIGFVEHATKKEMSNKVYLI